jgi:hypothetical protein
MEDNFEDNDNSSGASYEDDDPETLKISTLPTSIDDHRFKFNLSLALGLSLTSGAWIESVTRDGQADLQEMKKGLRVVKVESKGKWFSVETTRELSAVLQECRLRGDEKCQIICTGAFWGELKWNGACAGMV